MKVNVVITRVLRTFFYDDVILRKSVFPNEFHLSCVRMLEKTHNREVWTAYVSHTVVDVVSLFSDRRRSHE